VIAEVLHVENLRRCFALELPFVAICVENTMSEQGVHAISELRTFFVVQKIGCGGSNSWQMISQISKSKRCWLHINVAPTFQNMFDATWIRSSDISGNAEVGHGSIITGEYSWHGSKPK
jgi:hypothetical protein